MEKQKRYSGDCAGLYFSMQLRWMGTEALLLTENTSDKAVLGTFMREVVMSVGFMNICCFKSLNLFNVLVNLLHKTILDDSFINIRLIQFLSSLLTDLIRWFYQWTTLKIWSVSHSELSYDFRRVMWDIWTSLRGLCSFLWSAKARNWAWINEELQFLDELQGGQSKLLQDFKVSSFSLRSPAASLSVGDISNPECSAFR